MRRPQEPGPLTTPRAPAGITGITGHRAEDTGAVVLGRLAAVAGRVLDVARTAGAQDDHPAPAPTLVEGDRPAVARHSTTTLVDDLDDTLTADETVSLSVDGVDYEIDLSTDNATRLRDDLATWVDHARRTGARRSPTPRTRAGSTKTSTRTPAGRPDTGTVRDWARENGFTVADRGRIPAAAQQAYDAAH